MAQFLEHTQEEEGSGKKNDSRDVSSDLLNKRRIKQAYRVGRKTTVTSYKAVNNVIKVTKIRTNQEKERISLKNNVYSPYKANQMALTNTRFEQQNSRIQKIKRDVKRYARDKKQKIILNFGYTSPKDKIKVNKIRIKKKKGKVGEILLKRKLISKFLGTLKGDGSSSNAVMRFLIVIALLPIVIKAMIATILIGNIAAIISAVISFIISVINFIISIFVLKSYDIHLADTYAYITQLDTIKNAAIHEVINSDEYKDYDINLYVNGSKSNVNDFLFYSNVDNMLYFLDIKFQENQLSKNISSSSPFGGKTVKDELKNMHDTYFSYEVEVGEKEIERGIITIDEETGEEVVETIIETKNVVDVYVTVMSFFEFLDIYPHALDEEEAEILEASEALEQYEDRIEYDYLFGYFGEVEVLNRYGYRGIEPKRMRPSIDINAADEETVHAIAALTVKEVSVSDGKVSAYAPNDKMVVYLNLKDIYVKKGQKLKRGDIIGVPNDVLTIQVLENRYINGYQHLNPSFYIDDLTYAYRTNLGHITPGNEISGDLLNPPATVTQWKDEVLRAAKQYGVEEYVNILLAIIWIESGGNANINPDIMQASESLNGQVGSITDPIQSINQGVKYFAELLSIANANGLNEYAALQAYNYGLGFLNYLVMNETDYTFSEAVEYAKKMSTGTTVPYSNPVAINKGYNWRYQYGNMFYVDLVMQHIFIEENSLVEIAREELGYVNGDKYWRWYGFDSRIEWSTVFVSWVANQSGHVQSGKVLSNASTQAQLEWFLMEDRYEEVGSGYSPKPGDFIYFDYDGNGIADHVGIVEDINESTVTTIEGNVANKVARRTYSFDDITILGYGLTD